MKSDKLLVWIVVVIAVLAAAAVTINSFRDEATYINENTPEAVVHDFVLAIQKEEYKKAHGFVLSDIKYEEFMEYSVINTNGEYGIIVESSEILDQETAIVRYLVVIESQSFVESSYSYTESATLMIEEDGGDWKISQMYPYLMEYFYGLKSPIREP
jgi:hypothetical protein